MEYDDVIAALGDPRIYPEYEGRSGPPASWPLEHIQTTISHVFLTERFAYKLKKPLSLGFLDYSTLEPPDEVPFDMRARVDTAQPLAATLEEIRRLSLL